MRRTLPDSGFCLCPPQQWPRATTERGLNTGCRGHPCRHPERSRGIPDPMYDEVDEEHRVTEGTSILPPMPCNGLSKGENTKRGVVAGSKDFSNPQERGHLRGYGISFRSSTNR